MKYYEVEFWFNAQFNEAGSATDEAGNTMDETQLEDARDLLCALAGEADFETFEETEHGVKGYVQQSLFSEEALREAVEDFPYEGISVSYDIREVEDRDWNEQWEQEGFEPILVEGEGRAAENGTPASIIIHDGRHLPQDSLSPSTLAIEIDARLAFGTGTHETTRMICQALTGLPRARQVLDCGTGTGILSICALKLGAGKAIGYDIDEWSVDNARHNAVINRVDDRFKSLLGDASIINTLEGEFDLVMANINRNILLQDMPLFCSKMTTGATLILSGFYTADIPMLTEKAATLGLRLISTKEDNDWTCVVLRQEAL